MTKENGKSNITPGVASTNAGKNRHPYMRNNFQGTPEIQEIRRQMFQPPPPVVSYDFRREEEKA